MSWIREFEIVDKELESWLEWNGFVQPVHAFGLIHNEPRFISISGKTLDRENIMRNIINSLADILKFMVYA